MQWLPIHLYGVVGTFTTEGGDKGEGEGRGGSHANALYRLCPNHQAQTRARQVPPLYYSAPMQEALQYAGTQFIEWRASKRESGQGHGGEDLLEGLKGQAWPGPDSHGKDPRVRPPAPLLQRRRPTDPRSLPTQHPQHPGM